MNILRHRTVPVVSTVHVCDIFNVKKLANGNLMQAYIKSLIWFGSKKSKLLMFLNWSQSICGWTVLPLIIWQCCNNLHGAICTRLPQYLLNVHFHVYFVYVTIYTDGTQLECVQSSKTKLMNKRQSSKVHRLCKHYHQKLCSFYSRTLQS